MESQLKRGEMNMALSRSALLVRSFALGALAAAALAGCGGGGGSADNAVVQSGSVPPTISGTPPTQVSAGQAYAFTPTASGPSGTTLNFSVQNLPSWATFSAATGSVGGTPSSANVGMFSGVVISVSDGSMTAALPAFSIQVNAQGSGGGSGTASLSWVPPSTNTNGTPLTDLAGFYVNYGNSPSALNQRITVASPSATSYTVQNLGSGTWYFTVVVYTSVGTESAPSDMASKTIS
jgi:hypothetical protein